MEKNPQAVMRRMDFVVSLLDQKNVELVSLGKDRAEAKGHYNVAKSKKTLELKQEGCAVSLMSTLVAGDKIVVKLCWEFDVAEVLEKACLQKIKDLRAELDKLRSELAMLKAEFTGQ